MLKILDVINYYYYYLTTLPILMVMLQKINLLFIVSGLLCKICPLSKMIDAIEQLFICAHFYSFEMTLQICFEKKFVSTLNKIGVVTSNSIKTCIQIWIVNAVRNIFSKFLFWWTKKRGGIKWLEQVSIMLATAHLLFICTSFCRKYGIKSS